MLNNNPRSIEVPKNAERDALRVSLAMIPIQEVESYITKRMKEECYKAIEAAERLIDIIESYPDTFRDRNYK